MIIEKSIVVNRPVDVAFKVFTEEIGRWWPLSEGFAFGGERTQDMAIEDRVGGRIYEKLDGGEEFVIGTVTAYDPPHVVAFTWLHPDWNANTEVEVRFSAEPAGESTRVELRHSGWDSIGADDAAKQFEDYEGGWDIVLGKFAGRADVRG